MSYASTTAGAIGGASSLGTYTHPDYDYYKIDWQQIRDCIAGERRIKDAGVTYLPPIGEEGGTTYGAYKQRAVFVNMVARTVSGLVGTVFRRELKLTKATKKIRAITDNVSREGLSLNLFAKKLSYEIFGLGRAGVLVDRPKGPGKPYMTAYITENIMDWETAMVDGREQLVYVLLREIYDGGRDDAGNGLAKYQQVRGRSTGRLKARFRVLVLDKGIYKQLIYNPDKDNEVNFNLDPDETIIPKKNGSPLKYIPFKLFGPLSATPEVQRSPVLDITTLNLAHYRTSAQLEHGRFFTALPIYYVPLGNNQGAAEYRIGPSVVWETPHDSKPGILEYFGTGLTELTKSLIEKEEAISNLGGRIMGIRSAGTTESELVFKMKQANELSILLNVTEAMSEGLTDVFRWWLDWQDINATGVVIQLNQDFKALNIASRELRAISLLYHEGILPISEVYRVLQESEFIADNISLEEFTSMLNNSDKNFPKQPDVEAQGEGYTDADARLRDTIDKRADKLERDKMSQEDRHVDKQIEAKEKADKAAAQVNKEMSKDGQRTQQFEQQQKDYKANKHDKDEQKEPVKDDQK